MSESLLGRLPVPPTPLLGREADMAAVTPLLLEAEGRVLTLTGPAGVGKTRLAVHLARAVADHFADGVVFVPLETVREPGGVVGAIAAAPGLCPPHEVPTTALHGFLRTKRLLLVLDTFEHLVAAAGDIADLLAAGPRVTVLVTSRAPLRLRSEQEYPVAPLALPDPELAHNPAEVGESPAVQLFVQHAQTVLPGFRLTEENAATLAAICRRLDGLPLAIGLAAVRVKLLPLATLLARLDRPLPLLVSGPRDLPERLQSMRRAIGWSYDLLGEGEQRLFRRLAVFAGGWTLELAEALTAAEVRDPAEVVGWLDELVDQSLVIAENRDAAARFRMLEMMRAFAWEQLEIQGEAETVQRSHAALCLQYVEQYVEMMRGESPDLRRSECQNRITTEEANLRGALAWAAHHDRDLAARLGRALQASHLSGGKEGDQGEGIHAARPGGPDEERLTEREMQVLRLLMQGRSNQAIAKELFVAVGTVKRHVNSILQKLNAQSRLEAVARARDRGLI